MAVFVMVIGANYSAFKSLFANTDGMAEGAEYIENTYSLKTLTEFIGKKPEYVSIVSFNVNDPDSGIYYGSEINRTMGSLGNIFLLIEYERQVNEGVLNPNAVVDLSEIDKYLLPQINQNAHEGALTFLTENEIDSITNDRAIQAMVQFNSLAIADYFWFKLGKQNIKNLMDSLALPNTEMPLPFSGVYSSIAPNLTSLLLKNQHIPDNVSSFQRDSMFTKMIEIASYFTQTDELNVQRKEIMEDQRLNLTFKEERDALSLFPQTTAQDMAHLLAKIWKKEIVNEKVSNAVKEKMGWALSSDSMKRSFTDYGAFYDARMGMLSGIDFGTSAYDAHTSVQAVFFDQLPVAFWLHLSANHMQEDYQQRLIWDPALFETTIQQIELHK